MAPHALVTLTQQLHLLIAYNAIDVVRDVELIHEHLTAAIEIDDEARGDDIERESFGFDCWKKKQYVELFRFTREEIEIIMEELDFPPDEYWKTPSGSRFSREEAMLFYLARLSYPKRIIEMTNMGFSAQKGALSELYTMVGRWLFLTHTSRLLQDGFTKWAARVPLYARAVDAYTGIPGLHCFGFIDGTSRAICRPGYWQRDFYSGHKRNHCLQFLSITSPDGMVLWTWGPTNGCQQDNFMLGESELALQLLPSLGEYLGQRYCVYGDPIFKLSDYVIKGFPTVERTWQQEIFNKSMNAARVSIEHIFGRVVKLWAFLDFKATHKLHGTSPAMAYLNGQFLTNVHNCLHPNQTSQQFGVAPPTLREYIGLTEVE